MQGSEHHVERVCRESAERTQRARLAIASLSGGERSALLRAMAPALLDAAPSILDANQRDMEAGNDLSAALRDRLRLDASRIESMAEAVRMIAAQEDPVGRVVDGRVLPNGIRLEKRRVPLGVVLVIYESRPNVTSDAAALCLKAGNAILLKGGREAAHSNRAIVEAMRPALAEFGVEDSVVFVDTTERSAIPTLVTMRGMIDLVIPRGGGGLMKVVTEAATIPVVKHDAGLCHLYIDEHLDGMKQAAIDIALNAKTQRPGVCNAIETLLVHESVAEHVLPVITGGMRDAGVEVRGDERVRELDPACSPVSDEDWDTEYLGLTLSVRVVPSLEEACAHIRAHGSQHTEAIVTSSIDAAQRFVARVDSASVMVNCSTRFADGGEYGLGAEIGISTDKLHARGPMGAQDLTTFQWVLTGSGQVRG
ncbi:MAG: glutamate-5-semialdehyde dehydrogenase [Planctomycetota bacterium]